MQALLLSSFGRVFDASLLPGCDECFDGASGHLWAFPYNDIEANSSVRASIHTSHGSPHLSSHL